MPMKYDLLPFSTSNTKKLDECYDVSLMVMCTKAIHVMYDLYDIFTILVPQHPDGPSIGTHPYDLYMEYGKLAIKQVALSNE